MSSTASRHSLSAVYRHERLLPGAWPEQARSGACGTCRCRARSLRVSADSAPRMTSVNRARWLPALRVPASRPQA